MSYPYLGAQELVPAPAVKVDRIDEVLFAPESSGRAIDPWDLGLERFAGSIRNLTWQVRDDVLEPALQHAGDLLHRF